MTVPITPEDEQLEPREIVRVFSMRINEQYEHDSGKGTQLGKAFAESSKVEESQQKVRIRQINDQFNLTGYGMLQTSSER